MIKFFIISLVFLSCSYRRNEEPRRGWEGKTKKEITRHPYFKNLKIKKVTSSNEREQLIFIDQTPFQTGAYCQSLGGCLRLPSYNCQYQVDLEKELIQKFHPIGVCPSHKTTEPLKR